MNGSSIVLPFPLGEPVDELWEVLLDLGETNLPWTLIGGQMVLLHAVEYGTVPVVVSQDGDIIADIRAEPKSIKEIVALLQDTGFELEGVNTDGVGHRYVRPGREGLPVKIDVLAPEGVGHKADLTTTKPGRTVQVPAGTQLLNRTEQVTVIHGDRTGVVPRPTLLAAIVGKAAACKIIGEDNSRHYRDLALLCSLLEDPFSTREGLGPKDLKRLSDVAELLDPRHPAWTLVPPELRRDGQDAFRVLCERPSPGTDSRDSHGQLFI